MDHDELEQIIRDLAAQSANAPANVPLVEPQRHSPYNFEWNVIAGCKGGASPLCDICLCLDKHIGELGSSSVAFQTWVEGQNPRRQPLFTQRLLEHPVLGYEPQDVVVAPYSDLFAPEISDEARDQIFVAMQKAKQHRFFLSTKFIRNARHYLRGRMTIRKKHFQWPLENVWLGCSVSTQAEYNEVVFDLCTTPAAHHFIALDPLLEPITITHSPRPNNDYFWPLSGRLQEYIGRDKNGQADWRELSESEISLGRIEWVLIGGLVSDVPRPPIPAWVESIVGPARMEGVPVWYMGSGSWSLVREGALMDDDNTLVIANPSGEVRGRGAGADTNAVPFDFAQSSLALFTRRSDIAETQPLVGGRLIQQKPPRPEGEKPPEKPAEPEAEQTADFSGKLLGYDALKVPRPD